MELYSHCLQRIVGFKWVFFVTVYGELLFWNGTLLSLLVENCWFQKALYCRSLWRIVGLKLNFIVTVCRKMLVSSGSLLSYSSDNCWFAVGLYLHSFCSSHTTVSVFESNEQVDGACSS